MNGSLTSNGIACGTAIPIDLLELECELGRLFAPREFGELPLRVVDRRPCPYMGTYSSEIVACSLGNEIITVFCKHAIGKHRGYGHERWGGVDYEARVYDRVLQPSALSVPEYYGLIGTSGRVESTLVIEYLGDGALQVNEGPFPSACMDAATWSGRFHSENQSLISQTALDFLNRFDRIHFGDWAARVRTLAEYARADFPWMWDICLEFEHYMIPLIDAPTTVIHGEFYPLNILFRNGTIFPIDWETAAIGPGEIDLASLVEGWQPDVAQLCIDKYCQAKWPGGRPQEFERRLAAGRLYWHFRWLGALSDWSNLQKHRWRFEDVRAISETLQ